MLCHINVNYKVYKDLRNGLKNYIIYDEMFASFVKPVMVFVKIAAENFSTSTQVIIYSTIQMLDFYINSTFYLLHIFI